MHLSLIFIHLATQTRFQATQKRILLKNSVVNISDERSERSHLDYFNTIFSIYTEEVPYLYWSVQT